MKHFEAIVGIIAPRLLKPIVMLAIGTLLHNHVLGQDKYFIYGKLKTQSGRLERATIKLEKNGVKDRVLMVEGSGKFEFELDYNNNYLISFSQDGYVTKKVSFNTNAPAERIGYGFDGFEFQVTIFKQYDDISTVVFDQPVAQIMFSNEIDEFDYDTDYTKSILKQMEEVEEKTRERDKEEEEKEKSKDNSKKKEKTPEIKKEKEEPEPPPKPAPELAEKEMTTPVPDRKPESLPEKKRTPNNYPPPPMRNTGNNVVVLQSYTVGEFSYPNLPAYGYINLGDGAGNREISKEQFQQYAQQYR